ncbi:MAG TPA: HEPN domain-containing protein [Candidatus Nanoarchaeia archaeon]|nr:HEPN domain-containing protein [Candidatus Nanoarchaeia archaeon]
MKEYDLQNLLNKEEILKSKLSEFLIQGIIKKQEIDSQEIKGHILKSENNLRFVVENIKLGFLDWAITGCYYSCYHAALALILTKSYSSKDHLATLYILISEFYKKEISKEDIELLSIMLDYQDVLFYVESKNKREDAIYSTKTKFEKQEVEQLRIKTVLFVNKIKSILKDSFL